MKNIGIINFHFAINYGAVLQCYALREAVNSLEGCNAEILNYCHPNENRETPSYLSPQQHKNKVNIFDDFLQKYLGIEKKDTSKATDLPIKEYYITGSDQVWNTSIYFVTPEYFLDFAPKDAVKISYAASLGSDIDKLNLEPNLYQKHIPSFDFISLREATHIDFIKQYTNKEVINVLDPTLLYTKDKYLPMISTKKPKEEFIFVFDFNVENKVFITEVANFLSIKYNMKIISYQRPEDFVYNNCDEYMAHLGPLDFLWYIQNAELIITNSFHCTAFSIIFEKPFYSFLFKNRGSRVSDLLKILNLEDRIIEGYRPLNEFNLELDYAKVNKILDVEREKSFGFLRKALGIGV